MESSTGNKTKFFGILNLTPDSFSDGGSYNTFESAIARAKQLVNEGVYCIDIGGDSTRPGSVCPGSKIEWERIGRVVNEVSKFCNVSVDTHHADTAKLAIKNGASIINDISSGSDPEMFRVVAESGRKIILTYTCCEAPHDFSKIPSGNVIERVAKFFTETIKRASESGIENSSIILDPGMGAFLSADPDDSWKLLSGFSALKEFNFEFMLSVSRKGFLKTVNEKSARDRDLASAFVSALAAINCDFKIDFQRVHNLKLHRELFDRLGV